MNKYGELTFLRKSDIGQVYQGILKSTRRRVIVRVFTDAGICEGVKEFDILSRLSQSEFIVNLVERIDADEKKRTVYRSPEAPTLIIVSEALDTELATFRMQFPNNILPLVLVQSLAFQVLTGLNEAHHAGIFVRDLRPVKIRVAGRELYDFRVKLSDFAAAKIVHNMSRNDSATPPKDLKIDDLRYQAPELLVGSRLYTSAVDLWSVGCILGI